jgi:hypothetical protein
MKKEYDFTHSKKNPYAKNVSTDCILPLFTDLNFPLFGKKLLLKIM